MTRPLAAVIVTLTLANLLAIWLVKTVAKPTNRNQHVKTELTLRLAQ